jgi:AraC-like DNA-binding protein
VEAGVHLRLSRLRALSELFFRRQAPRVYNSACHKLKLGIADTGLTPLAYYLEFKMKKLSEKLIDPNLTVAQAFDAFGLAYDSNSLKLFKAKFGVSPAAYKRQKTTVNKLRPKVSPWGARDCSGNPASPAGAEELQRKARLVVFLYPHSGYKNTARPCNQGFWRGSAKKAHIFFLTC